MSGFADKELAGNATITADFAKWLLCRLIYLKDMAEILEPCTKDAAEEAIQAKYFCCFSSIQKTAIKKESVIRIVGLVERAIASMHPEMKQVYRLRFRNKYSYKQIMERMSISKSTLVRRLDDIIDLIIVYVSQANQGDLDEFSKFFEE
jgi:DNA-directed RNA polymerase specialized sigma subunit